MQQSGLDTGGAKTASGIHQVGFTTDDIPVADRVPFWQGSLIPLVNTPTGDKACHAHVHGFRLGDLLFMEMQGAARRFRTGNFPDRQHAGLVVVKLRLEGCSEGTYNNRRIRICAGDIVLLDIDASFDFHMGSSRSLNLVIPHNTVNAFAGGRSLAYGGVVRGNSPEGVVLGHYLQAVWRQLPEAETTDVNAINQMLLSCIAGAFDAGGATAGEHPQADGQINFERASAYIERHLHEPLDVKRLCRELSCSRNKLYNLFKPHGGVAHYIRTTRLEHCLVDLKRIKNTSMRIGDVSRHWGFSSQSHFTRLFRDAFGMTPSEVVAREEAVQPPATPGYPGFFNLFQTSRVS